MFASIAFFRDNFTHLNNNTVQRGQKAIFARNCPAFMFNFIVKPIYTCNFSCDFCCTFKGNFCFKCKCAAIPMNIGVCGVALLLSFLCSILVNKIPHCGTAVNSNTTMCDVFVFKPTVFGEMKSCASLWHQ